MLEVLLMDQTSDQIVALVQFETLECDVMIAKE